MPRIKILNGSFTEQLVSSTRAKLKDEHAEVVIGRQMARDLAQQPETLFGQATQF